MLLRMKKYFFTINQSESIKHHQLTLFSKKIILHIKISASYA